MIASKDNERLKLVRKLHDRRWREKLGLFFVEGEDAVEAATAEPVDLLRAGEDVEPKLLAEVASAPHPPRVIAVYRRADLPAWEERPATLALWRLADPGNVGTLIRTADAFGAAVALSRRLRRSDLAEGAARERRLDLARAARAVGLCDFHTNDGLRSTRTAASRSAASISPAGSRSCSARSGRGCRPRSSATSTRGSRSRAPSR